MSRNGMRFESMADMPAGMRQKVTPIVSRAALEKNKAMMPVKIDGVKFTEGKIAARYLYLADAQRIGLIKDLRIRERITVKEPFISPGGGEHKGIFYTADFSYIVADFDYRDGFLADDLARWEAIFEQAYEERVFEFVKHLGPEEKERLREKCVLFIEI